MKKHISSKQLLAETDPRRLKVVAIGAFLSFFVYVGAFITTDATLRIFYNNNSLLTAITYTCGDSCIAAEPTNSTYNTGTTYPKAYTLNRDGYMYGDTNKDGKLSADEINAWNATHNPDGSPKTTTGGGGSGKTPTQTQTTPNTSSLYSDYGCLSATGCDDMGSY
jgi:hypothetical protein